MDRRFYLILGCFINFSVLHWTRLEYNRKETFLEFLWRQIFQDKKKVKFKVGVIVICLLFALLPTLSVYLFKPWTDTDEIVRDYGNYTTGPCSSFKCGINLVHQKSFRIIGGETVIPYSWPWQAALMKKNEEGSNKEESAYFLTCGATLISDQWVLTAAHCFLRDQNPANFIIKLGAFNVDSDDEPGEMVLKVQSIFIYPEFDQKTYNNDIALLKLENRIQCNDHIVPVCLPKQADPMPPAGSMLTITGWGETKEGAKITSSTLRQAAVPFISRLMCLKDYGLPVNYAYNFCAGYTEGGIDSCQGDSGGPAVYRPNDQSPWVQLGITSWGNGCARVAEPGVYSRVSSYIDWISQYTSVMHIS